jgi:hypothetical protein
MASLPYILGLPLFQHNCLDCSGKDTITDIVKAVYSNGHHCQYCSAESFKWVCDETEDEPCKNQFYKVYFNRQIAVNKVTIKAATVALFSQITFYSNPFSKHSISSKHYSDVSQYIPDKPLSEWNCVFLL